MYQGSNAWRQIRVPFVCLASDDVLSSKSTQREVISLSERSASGEGISTCRVSGSGRDMMRQMRGAYRPVRNRAWAPLRRGATPSKRYCQLAAQLWGIPHQIVRNSRKKNRSRGASKSTSHPEVCLHRLHLPAPDIMLAEVQMVQPLLHLPAPPLHLPAPPLHRPAPSCTALHLPAHLPALPALTRA